MTRHPPLVALREGPKYGFQLAQEFDAGTGEVWPLNTGQVYTMVQRLERDDLVESDDGDEGSQKGFRITPSGRQELDTWLQTPPDTSSPPRDELVIKVLVALQAPGVDVADLTQPHRRLVRADAALHGLKEDADETTSACPRRRRRDLPAGSGRAGGSTPLIARIHRPTRRRPTDPAPARRRPEVGARR